MRHHTVVDKLHEA